MNRQAFYEDIAGQAGFSPDPEPAGAAGCSCRQAGRRNSGLGEWLAGLGLSWMLMRRRKRHA